MLARASHLRRRDEKVRPGICTYQSGQVHRLLLLFEPALSMASHTSYVNRRICLCVFVIFKKREKKIILRTSMGIVDRPWTHWGGGFLFFSFSV